MTAACREGFRSSPLARLTDTKSVASASPIVVRCACVLIMLLSAPAIVRSQTTTPPTATTPAETPTITDQPEVSTTNQPIHRPKAASRIVKIYDFEDRISSVIDIPKGWVRAQNDEKVPRIRPGFPIWNGAKLDFRVAANGKGSIRIPIDGGSASLRLKTGELPIFAGAKYKVTALVRSQGLVHARPRLVIRALDASGKPIPQSQTIAMVDHPSPNWQRVEAILLPIYDNAAYLQIDLEVVQERQFKKPILGKHQVWQEDFNAAAWFDSITVMQVPQVYLTTTSPLNIVARPEHPTLIAKVRDLTAQHMQATIRVADASGRIIDTTLMPITTGKATLTWTPTLDTLGWYTTTIDILSDEGIIASKHCDFLWLASDPSANRNYQTGPAFAGKSTGAQAQATRSIPFGLTLDQTPPLDPQAIGRALTHTHISALTLPVWQSSLREDTLDDHVDFLAQLSHVLHERWISMTLSLPVVPDELADTMGMDATDVAGVLSTDESLWSPYLYGAVDRLGNANASWQIGSTLHLPLAQPSTLTTHLGEARNALEKLVPSLLLDTAWRADLSPAFLDASSGTHLQLGVPEWIDTQGMQPMVDLWQHRSFAATTSSAAQTTLPTDSTAKQTTPTSSVTTPVMRTLSTTYVFAADQTVLHTPRQTAARFARRFVAFWAALTADNTSSDQPVATETAVSLAQPWTIETDDHPVVNPTAILATWRQLADRLDHRVFAGMWSIKPGIRCYIFKPAPHAPADTGGLLVLWNQTALPDSQTGNDPLMLDFSLGNTPLTMTDLFGNSRTIAPSPRSDQNAATGQHYQIPLNDEPVFLEGIDTNLAIFLASIQLAPPTILSAPGEHEHEIVLHNPWPIPITGKLVISKPGGYDPRTQSHDRSWTITPRTIEFAIKPNSDASYPIVLSFSQSILAQPTPFVFDVKLSADTEYDWTQATIMPTVQWPDISFDLSYLPSKTANGDLDIIVEAAITNTSTTPRALEAAAFAPGLARQRATIGQLEPGQSITRRFIFPNGYATLAGKDVFVSLVDPSGAGRLNKSIRIHRIHTSP